MALTIVSTLPVTVLVTVVIPGLSGFRITNTSLSDIRLPRSIQSNLNLPDGYITHPGIGVAYKVYNETVMWKTARERCISEGAHLAVIDTYLKFEYLMTHPSIGDSKWTGIHGRNNGTKWVSDTTGLTMTTLPWAQGEPFGGHDCVRAGRSPRGLRNIECNTQLPYVCELPIPEKYNIQMGQPRSTSVTVLPNGYTAFWNLGVVYKYHENLVNWNTARKNCMTEDTSLAVVDSYQKYQAIRWLIGNQGPHVGIHRFFDNQEWVSVATGAPMKYIPWAAYSYRSDPARGCVAMCRDRYGVCADECSWLRPYLCEIPINTHHFRTDRVASSVRR